MEKEKEKVDRELEVLQQELSDARLALIRKQLAQYQKLQEKKHKEEASLDFEEERKALYSLISQSQPKVAYEAQEVLDQILEMITNQSNGQGRKLNL